MKPGTGTIILVAAFLIVFGIELASHSVGNEALLLKLGALPDNGELYSQYWRLATYSFLHLNGTHLLVNAMLLLWIGRVVENRVTFADASASYGSGVLCSAAMILFVHHVYPKAGATMGASGGVFGLFAAALIVSYREKAEPLHRQSRLRTLLWIACSQVWAFHFSPASVWLVMWEVSSAGQLWHRLRDCEKMCNQDAANALPAANRRFKFDKRS